MRLLLSIFLIILFANPAFAQPKGAGAAPPPPVEVTTVTRAPLFDTISAIGTLSANESVILRPEIAGLIKSIEVDEGQPVKAGQPLFVLDQDILSAEARSASSNANLGAANLQRERKLKESGYSTQQSLDAAHTNAVANKANATVAQVRLSKTIVRAPFDGILGLRSVSLGDYVNIGQNLVNLEQINPIKLDFSIPEIYLSSLHTGMKVEVRVDAYPSEVFTGEVYAFNPKVDEATRSIAARARISNPDFKLRPGLFARVSVPVGDGQPVLVVPETTLTPDGSRMLAIRLDANKNAEQVEVKMGRRNNGMVEIISGLNENDTVVVTGQMRVVPGKPVNVVNTIAPQSRITTQPQKPAAVTNAANTAATAPATVNVAPDNVDVPDKPAEIVVQSAPESVPDNADDMKLEPKKTDDTAGAAAE